MLQVSQRLNPECGHVMGDMRPVKFRRTFDGILVHDAVSSMASRADLGCAIATAFEHSSYRNTGHDIFLGLRPVAGTAACHQQPIRRFWKLDGVKS